MKDKCLKGFFLSLFIFLTLVFGGQSLMAGEVPAEAQKAAEKGLPTILQTLPDNIVQQFGFSGPEELSLASLGSPFQVFTIHPAEILNYSADTPIGDIISGTDHWFFPVTVNGEVRTLLTVAQVGGQWQAVYIGSAGLGQQWAKTLAKYETSAGYTHTLVRIYQAKADFVLLGGIGGDKLLPLESGRVALGVKGDTEPRDPADIIFELQGPVQKNIEAHN
jgi:hypothetical protein